MTAMFTVLKRFAFVGLGAGLVVATGCESELGAPKKGATSSQPEPAAPATGPIRAVEKDLKPPVVIKPDAPDAPSGGGKAPPAPK